MNTLSMALQISEISIIIYNKYDETKQVEKKNRQKKVRKNGIHARQYI